MDESIDPELSDGGTSHAGGKHQAGGTSQAGKHQADGPRSVRKGFSRRKMLISGGALAAGFAGLEALRSLAVTPARVASPAAASLANARAHRLDLPETQFDIGAFTAPAVTINNVLVAFGPVFTLFAPATLMSATSREDQDELARALDETRFALEEAVPSPTDVSPANPGITKKTFNVPVQIEANELLVTIRSDNTANVWDVLAFLGGSDMLAGMKVPSPRLKCGLTFTGTRLMFVQQGLPRKVAEQNNLPFTQFLNPSSPMWMGFADQQVDATAPANDVTFAGADGILFTTAQLGDYFDRASLQHLSHDILDMAQFFDLNAAGVPGEDGVFLERVQYMFRSNPPPSMGRADQLTNGGGPAFVPNVFQGAGDAAKSAAGIGTPRDPATGATEHRIGHIACLQRSSRTADGRPIHVRNDGPGFDSLDVPDGTKQPKLEFMVFVPTAEFFRTMRVNQASLDLQAKFHVPPTDNGLERFITATRRQNFLLPPRRHRAFPLIELT